MAGRGGGAHLGLCPGLARRQGRQARAEYRSREPILRLANTLITHNTARHQKALHATRSGGTPPRFVRFDDETAEAQEVVGDVQRRLDASGRERVRARDVAIPFRTNEQPRAFEVELRRRKIPYVLVGGLSF